MADQKRRDFIKKGFLAGLFSVTGLPFLVANKGVLKKNQLTPELPKIPSKYEDIDWDKIRNSFPLSRNVYYFNTSGTGLSPQVVINKICEMTERQETSSNFGHTYMPIIHEKIADFLNTDVNEIAVTRNTTEGMNIVARSLSLKKGDEVLITKHEHIGGAAPWIALQEAKGVVIKLVELDLTGKDNLKIIEENITKKTKVVSFSHITCTTGMRLPAKEIVELCKRKEIYSCIDGAQALGMIPVDLKDINPDFYVSSGHKWLLGSKGTGILFINKLVIEKLIPGYVGAYSVSKFNLNELLMEYKMNAHREEYGTRNIPVMLGLLAAIDFISTIGIENVSTRGKELASYFRSIVIQNPKVELLTSEDPDYSASIVTIRIKGMDYLAVKQKLRDDKKCKLRDVYENNINGLRFSFSILNSMSDVDYLFDSLEEIIPE